MTRRRFHAPPDAFTHTGDVPSVTLASDEARHLRDVLRLRAGDEAFVFDGEGNEYRCTVADAGHGRARGGDVATLAIEERVAPPHAESPLRLTLALALLKNEKFDLVVQKATELGVSRIVPVMTKRGDVRWRDAGDAEKRRGRSKRLALEAAKQSGRACVPAIDAPATLSAVLSDQTAAGADCMRVMFTERAGHSLTESLNGWPARTTSATDSVTASVTALVGPEGGWEDEEIAQARDAGWLVVTLGGRTLRAETAAVTAVVLLQHLGGDLR